MTTNGNLVYGETLWRCGSHSENISKAFTLCYQSRFCGLFGLVCWVFLGGWDIWWDFFTNQFLAE